MMKRLSLLAVALAFFAAGCGSSSSTAPSSPTKPTFTATLSPANEVPPVTNAESTVTGNATITIDATKDAAGNITAATVTFVVNLSGFPAGSTVNIAHIHEGASTCACPVVVNTTLAAGEVTISGGSATFTKAGINIADPAIAQRIINNPAGFYFNVHTALNGGGVARGTLVKVS
jgi:hypothetical protein